MIDDKELKPCPLCGSGAKYQNRSIGIIGTGGYDSWSGIRCSFCDLYIGDDARRFRSRAEAASVWNFRVVKPDKDYEAIVDERDLAQEALSQAYYLVTGKSPEWSNLFGVAEAMQEIDDTLRLLRQSAIPIPAGSVGDKALALEMFDRDSVRNKQNMYQFRDEDIDLIHAALTAPVPASVDLEALKYELNGAFSHNSATGSLHKAGTVNQAIDWIAYRYTISKKE